LQQGQCICRDISHFAISGLRVPRDVVTATILVKKAAAQANSALDRLDHEVAAAIVTAADEILGGAGDDRLSGANGADTINGEDGNDAIAPGLGDDEVTGGAGTDRMKSS